MIEITKTKGAQDCAEGFASSSKPDYLKALTRSQELLALSVRNEEEFNQKKHEKYKKYKDYDHYRLQVWREYQLLNLLFAKARADVKKEPLAFGCFPRCIAAHYSDFCNTALGSEDILFTCYKDSEPTSQDIVVGWGPADFKLKVRAMFDTTEDHRWSTKDAHGEQLYQADSKHYICHSQCGQYTYELVADDNVDCTLVEPDFEAKLYFEQSLYEKP